MKETEYRCSGCGILIQTDDPKKLGYVPKSKYREPLNNLLCQRCYRIRHYQEIKTVNQYEADFLQVLDQIRQSKSLVVQVIDLFDFAGSIIPGVHRHIGNNSLILLANKIDLFPRSIKQSKLKKWVEQSAQELGIYPLDVHLCSAYKGWCVEEAMAKIEKHRQGRNVYVIGTANVGKSTLINRLINPETQITTSRYPGTTLGLIQIPLKDRKMIIDTPGVLRPDRLSEWLTPEELKIALPMKEMKPKIYQLHNQQTLFLGGLSRIDYIQGNRQSFVCYVSNQLLIHRTKLANADEIQQKHLGNWLIPPSDPNRLPKWEKHRISLSGQKKEDIVIAGLGFISTGREKAIIDVWVPKGIQIETRLSIV